MPTKKPECTSTFIILNKIPNAKLSVGQGKKLVVERGALVNHQLPRPHPQGKGKGSGINK